MDEKNTVLRSIFLISSYTMFFFEKKCDFSLDIAVKHMKKTL